MRAIRGLQGGLFLSVAGLVAGCELIVGVGNPRLREQDAGSGGEGGTGGTGGTTTTTTSSSSSSSRTSTSSGTGGAEPTCTDGAKNGVETDKDCGGGECPACAIGKGCVVGTDCDSSACSANHICVAPQCNDQTKNGDESDVDCGGLSCPGCANGKVCEGNGDCQGGNCVAKTCEPPSCAGGGSGKSDCGPTANESCCASLPVTGGTFKRSYDGVTFTDASFPATVSSFKLDKYEVTVGRFRQFVDAWVGGWRPAAGAGRHTHLNGGNGLAAIGGGHEPGWDTTWEDLLASTKLAWDTSLACVAPGTQTWTSTAGSNEKRPLNCVAWQEALAFCTWDGGFLPSEAEWNYAAAGGSEQRVYPWSTPANSTTIDCSHATYNDGASCSASGPKGVGSASPGNGKWGHADLGGNVWEWALDWGASYSSECSDCTNLTLPASRKAIRGGGYTVSASLVAASYRSDAPPESRGFGIGIRCARSP